MASNCFASLKGLAMRATRVDGCGQILSGANASVTSCGFVSIGMTANIEDGEEFTQKLANGDLCISEKDASILKFVDLSMAFCEVDPELYELMTGNRVLTDGFVSSNDSIGFTLSEALNTNGFALEVWTKIAGTAGCSGASTAAYQWVYWLMPNVVNATIGGDITIENGPMTFTITANTATNPEWGVGPYNVFDGPDVGTVAGRLPHAVADDEHLYVIQTDVAPPECACGYQTV